MKKLWVLFVLLAMLCMMVVPAFAEETVADSSSSNVNLIDVIINGILGSFDRAFKGIGSYYDLLVSKVEALVPYKNAPVLLLLLVLCFFGYRCYKVETWMMGGLIFYCVGHTAYDFILAWNDKPEALNICAEQEVWLRWVVVGVLALIGFFLGEALKRFGMSIAIAFLCTVWFSHYTVNYYILGGIFAFLFIFGLFAMRSEIIVMSSLVGGINIVKYSIGTEGLYPIDIEGMFNISGINVWLVLSLFIAVLGALIQYRSNRGRRFY